VRILRWDAVVSSFVVSEREHVELTYLANITSEIREHRTGLTLPMPSERGIAHPGERSNSS
jgi:hypothetical protein